MARPGRRGSHRTGTDVDYPKRDVRTSLRDGTLAIDFAGALAGAGSETADDTVQLLSP
jgi:hypothetical protein